MSQHHGLPDDAAMPDDALVASLRERADAVTPDLHLDVDGVLGAGRRRRARTRAVRAAGVAACAALAVGLGAGLPHLAADDRSPAPLPAGTATSTPAPSAATDPFGHACTTRDVEPSEGTAVDGAELPAALADRAEALSQALSDALAVGASGEPKAKTDATAGDSLLAQQAALVRDVERSGVTTPGTGAHRVVELGELSYAQELPDHPSGWYGWVDGELVVVTTTDGSRGAVVAAHPASDTQRTLWSTTVPGEHTPGFGLTPVGGHGGSVSRFTAGSLLQFTSTGESCVLGLDLVAHRFVARSAVPLDVAGGRCTDTPVPASSGTAVDPATLPEDLRRRADALVQETGEHADDHDDASARTRWADIEQRLDDLEKDVRASGVAQRQAGRPERVLELGTLTFPRWVGGHVTGWYGWIDGELLAGHPTATSDGDTELTFYEHGDGSLPSGFGALVPEGRGVLETRPLDYTGRSLDGSVLQLTDARGCAVGLDLGSWRLLSY